MKDLKKSMLDLAEEQFAKSEQPIRFSDLWATIVKEFEMSEEEVRQRLPLFYTSLSMDGRFVVLEEDLWDLKSKHTYNEVHVDINDIYQESEEEEDVDAEEEDDDEKPASKKNKSEDDDEDEDDDSEADEEDKDEE